MSIGIAPPPQPRHLGAKFRWGYFVAQNLIAVALAVGVYWFVAHASFLDGPVGSIADFFLARPALMSFTAALPLVVTVMIGVAYARRGARRRRLAARE